jgi:F-type H+-transporting ATPase subunit b
MMEILNSLGFEWPNFIAQLIVFIIVLAVLKKYAFGPVTEVLEQRRQRIAEAEANHAKTRAALAEAETEARRIIGKANDDASRMVKEAEEAAAVTGERRRQEAIAEAAAIIAKGREASALERDQAMVQLKRDFGRLLVDATAKVTGKVLTPADHQTINQETVAQISR